jgi:hypothetical protein
MNGREASRTSNTSHRGSEVNQRIPVAWNKKDSVRRLRRADFKPKKGEVIDDE